MPDPKIEVYTDAAGKPRYRILGGNGEITLTAEAYASDDNAERAIADNLTTLVTALHSPEGLLVETPTGARRLCISGYGVAHWSDEPEKK